jgi:hypothetical protein
MDTDLGHAKRDRMRMLSAACSAFPLTCVVVYSISLFMTGFRTPISSLYVVAVVMPPVFFGIAAAVFWSWFRPASRPLTVFLIGLISTVCADGLLSRRMIEVQAIDGIEPSLSSHAIRTLMILLPSAIAGAIATGLFIALARLSTRGMHKEKWKSRAK